MSAVTSPDKAKSVIIPAIFAVVATIALFGFIFTLRRRFPSPTMQLLNAARSIRDEEAGLPQNQRYYKATTLLPNDSGYLTKPKVAHLSSSKDAGMLYLPPGIPPSYTVHTQQTVENANLPGSADLPAYEPCHVSLPIYMTSTRSTLR